MAAPTPINLYGKAGATLVVDLAVFRKNASGVQTPVDLTGATLYMTVKYRYADPDPGFAQITSAGANVSGGIIVTDAANGLATATFYDTVTTGVSGQTAFVYDVKVIEADGDESIPIFGTLTITPAVTRAL